MIHLYKALSFDDQIKFAYEGLINGEIQDIKFDFIIVDEYQDFNKCEKEIINKLTLDSKYTLFAGDDDQVLYDTLKNSHKEYIREIYNNTDFKRAFLPFCSRCSSNIVTSAGFFIENNRSKDPESIDKIYIPINSTDESSKIRVIACQQPSSAMSYIKSFITDHSSEIADVETKINLDESINPFLFVISPSQKCTKYFNGIKEIIEEHQHVGPNLTSSTYEYLLDYLTLSKNPENNYIFRKILKHEKIEKAHLIVNEALTTGKNILEIQNKKIREIQNNAKIIQDIYMRHQLNDIDALVKEFCDLDFIKIIRDNNKDSVDILKHEIRDFKFDTTYTPQESLNAIELMSFPGCKGLTAEHVFIIGFDDTNMNYITENAFYVAMTRAKKTLHLITTLRVCGAKLPHTYLKRLPTNNLNFLKHTKKDGSTELGSLQKFNATIEEWGLYNQKG